MAVKKRELILLVVILLLPSFPSQTLATTVEKFQMQVGQVGEKLEARENLLQQEFAKLQADSFSGQVLLCLGREIGRGPGLPTATNAYGLRFLDGVATEDGRLVANSKFAMRSIMDLNYNHKDPNGFSIMLSLRSISSPFDKGELILAKQNLNLTVGKMQLNAGDYTAEFSPFTLWGKRVDLASGFADAFNAKAQLLGWQSFPSLRGLLASYYAKEGSITGLWHNQPQLSNQLFALRSEFQLGRLAWGAINILQLKREDAFRNSLFGGEFAMGYRGAKLEVEAVLSHEKDHTNLTAAIDSAWLCSISGRLAQWDAKLKFSKVGEYFSAPLGEKDLSLGYDFQRNIFSNPFNSENNNSGPQFEYFQPGASEPGRQEYALSLQRKFRNVYLYVERRKISQIGHTQVANWQQMIDNKLIVEYSLYRLLRLPVAIGFSIQNGNFQEQLNSLISSQVVGLTIDWQFSPSNNYLLGLERREMTISGKTRSKYGLINCLRFSLGRDANLFMEHSISSLDEIELGFVAQSAAITVRYSF